MSNEKDNSNFIVEIAAIGLLAGFAAFSLWKARKSNQHLRLMGMFGNRASKSTDHEIGYESGNFGMMTELNDSKAPEVRIASSAQSEIEKDSLGVGEHEVHSALRLRQQQEYSEAAYLQRTRENGVVHKAPPHAKMSIYLAGPDVFQPGYEAGKAEISRRLLEMGILALFPYDGKSNNSYTIAYANMAIIERADAILANLNPFRGEEPDSGTAFEVGYAIAKRKKVVGYLQDGESLLDKMMKSGNAVKNSETGTFYKFVDNHGNGIENFGNPVNLMLASSCDLVAGNLWDAAKLILEWYEKGPGE